MGILEALLGKDNGIAQWAGQNNNLLTALGAGLGSGQNLSQGLSNGLQMVPQAKMLDMQAAQAMEAKTKQAQQQEAFKGWLAKTRPDLLPLMDAGVDSSTLFNKALEKPAAPDYPAEYDLFKLSQSDPAFAQYLNKGDAPKLPEGMMLGPNGTQIPVPGGKEAFDRSDALWKEYQAAEPVKSYQLVRNGYERLRTAATQGNGAGDVSMIFAYMKMLDPTSVVREGEFATAEQTGGVPAQITNLYNKLLNGERLTPEQRKQFVSAADGLYQETVQNLEAANTQYGGRAKQWGVDPTGIVMSPEAYQPLDYGVPGADPAVENLVNKWLK